MLETNTCVKMQTLILWHTYNQTLRVIYGDQIYGSVSPMEIIKFCTCRSFLNNRNSIYIHDISRWVPLLTASSIMYGSFVSTEIYQRCQFRNTKLQNITRVVLFRLQMCNYGCNKLSAEQKIIQYNKGTKDLPQKSC